MLEIKEEEKKEKNIIFRSDLAFFKITCPIFETNFDIP